ncbi:MAG: hypothetical protein WBX17_01940 [Microbacterium sp.]
MAAVIAVVAAGDGLALDGSRFAFRIVMIAFVAVICNGVMVLLGDSVATAPERAPTRAGG